jgi:iron-sulfur cluster assembly accessory protein
VTRKRKDPILVTPAAASRIKELLASPNGEGSIGIRLGVKRRGCNGLSYTLNYAFQKEPNEEVMESHGVTIFIEPMALFNVVGTVMDWEETDMSSEFTFQNPNSKGECGCGESFNV